MDILRVTSDCRKGFSKSFIPKMWNTFPANAKSPVANVKRDLWHEGESNPVQFVRLQKISKYS